VIDLPDSSDKSMGTRLRLKRISGRRVIAMEEERRRGSLRFALGPEASPTPEAGLARDRLLQWIKSVESERNIEVSEIFWDNHTLYWLEIGGERIPHADPIAPLEFGR